MHVDCVKQAVCASGTLHEFTVMLPAAIHVSRSIGPTVFVSLVVLLLRIPEAPRGKKTSKRMMKRVKRLPAGARSFMTIFGYTWSRVAWRIRCCFPLRWKITWSVVRHLPRPFSFLPADRLSPIDMRVLKTSAERENSSLFFALFRYEVTDKRSNSYRQV